MHEDVIVSSLNLGPLRPTLVNVLRVLPFFTLSITYFCRPASQALSVLQLVSLLVATYP